MKSVESREPGDNAPVALLSQPSRNSITDIDIFSVALVVAFNTLTLFRAERGT